MEHLAKINAEHLGGDQIAGGTLGVAMIVFCTSRFAASMELYLHSTED
jgi:hypothetical protein